MTTAKMRPMTHERSVDDGIVGSSVFATADRTSGYGESSSSASALLSRFGSSNAGSGSTAWSWPTMMHKSIVSTSNSGGESSEAHHGPSRRPSRPATRNSGVPQASSWRVLLVILGRLVCIAARSCRGSVSQTRRRRSREGRKRAEGGGEGRRRANEGDLRELLRELLWPALIVDSHSGMDKLLSSLN